MPRRNDIESVLILGAGPIVIGQACEFDYSGAQACKALREENYRVILVNSNPATIMTDPGMADATYIEPIRWESIEKIIEKERPNTLLPTMGGQTALNCALDLNRLGILKKYNVEMIGADSTAIDKAEDRDLFKQAMKKLKLNTPLSGIAHDMNDAYHVLEKVGFPCIIRPSFTMGGYGGGIAYNREEFKKICKRGFDLSPTSELLIDESLLGWKEYEMEVVRDKNDNCIIVCAIENFDPMGIHTGDSITVAPTQTLTDQEYQIMRNASFQILREIGVETGGANVQFAINPKNGRMVVIEMNPRVSRSSALASKATGFPIAKVAAKLAVGYSLDELRNEITGDVIPSSFEPTIDYVITKIPRFAFEKFPKTNDKLTTQMKSVGEVMAIGRNFQESLQKALRSLEINLTGLDPITHQLDTESAKIKIKEELSNPGYERIRYIADAFRLGFSLQDVHHYCKVDPWFLDHIQDLINEENSIADMPLQQITEEHLRHLKQKGFSDARIATLVKDTEKNVRQKRLQLNIKPIYKRIDSCAAEFETNTIYMYSSYDEECESAPTDKKKIIILGGGPNRIGQGIEFDYCCVHAALAMKEQNFETIMVNCNPETVSTDYDTSDRLYFEPVTVEDILNIVANEKPHGVIVHYGGQTPLKLARALKNAGAPIIGTDPDAIDRAEDRDRFRETVTKLNLLQPANGMAQDEDQAIAIAQNIGYPLLVRPSYVLGGRAMEIVQSEEELRHYMSKTIQASDSPILLDKYLEQAIEVDVDLISDGQQALVCAIMQHIEQAGIHSGDSCFSLPPYSVSESLQQSIKEQVQILALELNVIGLMNVQLAIKNNKIYLIEVNPRASRTIPFVSKAINMPLAGIAAKVMTGKTLKELGYHKANPPLYYFVKGSVFPFDKLPDVDPILGPEMRSTGEVMGIGQSFEEAYTKAELAVKMYLPKKGNALISICDNDKKQVEPLARSLLKNGFHIIATSGTAAILKKANIPVQTVNKVKQGRPNIVDLIVNGDIQFVINTTEKRQHIEDSYTIRQSALIHKVPYTTTMAGAKAITMAIEFGEEREVRNLQSLYHS